MIVGAWNALFGYVLFGVMLFLLAPLARSAGDSELGQLFSRHYYLIAQLLAWVIAVWESTIAFKYLVFRSTGSLLGEVRRAYLVYAPLQVIASGILWLMSGVLGLHPLAGQLVTAAVTAVLSYVGHRNFTFPSQTSEGPARSD